MTDRPLSDSLHHLDLRRIPRDLPASEYKLGDEFKPFHPSASHVPAEYRDGWNRCWLAALAAGGEPQPVAWQVGASFFQKYESIPDYMRPGAIPLYATPLPPSPAPQGEPSVDALMELVEELADEAHSNGYAVGASHGYNSEDRKSEAPLEAAIRASAQRLAGQGQAQAAPAADRQTTHPMLDGYAGSVLTSAAHSHRLSIDYESREQADRAHEWLASGQVRALTDDATKQQARDAVKRMHKARHFPSDTDACSRHVALMAETLAKGQPYPMLDEEREHCAVSLAITVAMLWEARAALSHQAGQKEGA